MRWIKMVSDKVALGLGIAGCVTAIEIVALMQGIDGILLTATVASVVGILAYLYPSPINDVSPEDKPKSRK